MRQLLGCALGCLALAMLFTLTGCGSDTRGQAEIPKETIELPKEGPVPAGGGKRGVPAPPPPKERID